MSLQSFTLQSFSNLHSVILDKPERRIDMTKEWDRVRDKVCEHYVNGKSLREVREIIATNHGFSAS